MAVRTEVVELAGAGPGQRWQLQALHFGQPGRGPKATIQAALHADEVPALVVAHHLRQKLAAMDVAGQVLGEVVLVPYANPVGLGQQLLGQQVGRFHLADGVNFNRLIPDLTDAVAEAITGRLTDDVAHNASLIRAELARAAQALKPVTPVAAMKAQLLRWATDADIVLDLHCDNQARLHLYGLTPQTDDLELLGALTGAEAILLATSSGDQPFDEACSQPWYELQQRFPNHPIPLGCFSTTVELRGEADTEHAFAEADADALIQFLQHRGVLAPPVAGLPPVPPLRCSPTPLAASEPVVATHTGALVFHCAPGAGVKAGDGVAEVLDPATGEAHRLVAQSDGVLYARISTRWVQAGQPVAKIAGRTLLRKGKLLGA